MNIIKRIVLASIMSAFILAGCGKNEAINNIHTLEDGRDLHIKVGTSSSLGLKDRIESLFPKSEIVWLEEKDALNGFNSGKIDAYIGGENYVKNVVKVSGNTLKILEEPVEVFEVVFGISKTSDYPDLQKKVNEFVAKGREDGSLKEIYDRWQEEGYDAHMGEVSVAENPKYTIRVGTAGFNKPFCYYKENELTGADIEIARNLAAYLDAEIIFEDSDYAGILTGINSGKYDIVAANLYATPERAETILMSDPYYDINMRMIVKKGHQSEKPTLETLKGKRAGVLTGTPQAEMISGVVDSVNFEYFNSFTDMALALSQNKIDFFVNNNVSFRLMQDEYPGFISLDEPVCSFDIGTIFPKNRDNEVLISQYNEYIESIKNDGTLEKLKSYWLDGNEWEIPQKQVEGENGTLTLATCTSNKPFAMMVDGGYGGFDIAIVEGFCEKYGYGLKIEDCDFAGMLAGISNGKYDLAAGQIAYTEERAQSVIYSDFYYEQHIVAIVNGESESKGETDALFESFKTGFRKTFIDENRYLMILSGIRVTIIITIFGFILANVIGGFICAMSMSGIRALRRIANIYSKIMQGTPIVVILMIIYYIIFGKTSINNVIVAIISFGISTAAYIAQIYKGAISQVNKGEIEAALALGLSRKGTFLGIVLPQAIRNMMPALSSQLVALMKGTAVVGYIAVMDMTKVSDIIRSSTYEAIFPLLSIALIYFLLSTVILLIVDRISYSLNPANKKRGVKGVKL